MPDMKRPARFLTHDFYPQTNPGIRVLKTSTYMYTGLNGSKTSPGVGFDLFIPEPLLKPWEPEPDYKIDNEQMYRVPIGVMDRDTVRRLHELIGEFLADFPEEAG